VKPCNCWSKTTRTSIGSFAKPMVSSISKWQRECQNSTETIVLHIRGFSAPSLEQPSHSVSLAPFCDRSARAQLQDAFKNYFIRFWILFVFVPCLATGSLCHVRGDSKLVNFASFAISQHIVAPCLLFHQERLLRSLNCVSVHRVSPDRPLCSCCPCPSPCVAAVVLLPFLTKALPSRGSEVHRRERRGLCPPTAGDPHDSICDFMKGR
jgi:hypothetical protein